LSGWGWWPTKDGCKWFVPHQGVKGWDYNFFFLIKKKRLV
jgi:hypothetical protein